MQFLDSTTPLAAGGTLLVLLAAFLLFQPNNKFVKWLQKKNYQYEVTSSLYMLTPTEKFIFNSILFLTLSLLTIACIVYLPDHVVTISRRAYYYFAGDTPFSDASRTAAAQLREGASKASSAVLGAATDLAEAAYNATVSTAAVAQEAVNQAAENLGWT